jgi:hypothetical protein
MHSLWQTMLLRWLGAPGGRAAAGDQARRDGASAGMRPARPTPPRRDIAIDDERASFGLE